MTAKQIFKMLPKELFLELSKKYNIDYKAKKLNGENIFKVLLYTMFSDKHYSLNKLKEYYDNEVFQKKFLKIENKTTIDKTSFHYRLNTLNPKYFEEIFFKTLKKFKKIPLLKKEKKYDLFIFDSTIVSLSSKLLTQTGFKYSGKHDKTNKIKYTIGLNSFPEIIKLHSKRNTNENKALSEAILSKPIARNTIILFDRGINSRDKLDAISDKNYFITRLNKSYKSKLISTKELNTETSTLNLLEEKEVKLYTSEKKETNHTYRVIHCSPKKVSWDKRKETKLKIKKTRKLYEESSRESLKESIKKEELVFVTNIPSEYLCSKEIVTIYKERWKIELFFKLLKQELHFSYLINRSENGIKIMLYMTMLFVLILMLYKLKNNLKGYKYVKSKLLLELQSSFYDFIVEISGGSKQKWRNTISNPFF